MVIDIIEINSFQRTPKFSVNIFVLQFKNNRKKKLKRKISLPPGNSCLSIESAHASFPLIIKTLFNSHKQNVLRNINETGMYYKMYKLLLFFKYTCTSYVFLNRRIQKQTWVNNYFKYNQFQYHSVGAISTLHIFNINWNLADEEQTSLGELCNQKSDQTLPISFDVFRNFSLICDQIPAYRLKLANSPSFYSVFKRSFRIHSVAWLC